MTDNLPPADRAESPGPGPHHASSRVGENPASQRRSALGVRRYTWRLLGWSSVLLLLALLSAGVLALLDPRQLSARSDAVHVVVRTRGTPDGTTTLVRQADRWVGSVRDFPDGSVTHIKPRGSPGFFLVRATGATFRAYSDRSPHRGEPVEYRNPMPGTNNDVDGPQAGLYDPGVGASYTLDGEPFRGPGPRPLDPFPLTVLC